MISPLLFAFLLALRPPAPDGVVIPVAGGFLKIEVVAADVIRVAFAPDSAFFARKSLAAGERTREAVPWKVVRVGDETQDRDGSPVGAGVASRGRRLLRHARTADRGGSARRPRADARRGPGRAHVPRAPGLAGESGRGPLRTRAAAGRPDGSQGLRPRPLAAQHVRGRARPRVEPRVRHLLGQHVVHPLRRSPAVRADPRRAAPRPRRPAGRADRDLLRRRGLRAARSARAWIPRSSSPRRTTRPIRPFGSIPRCPRAAP